MSFDKKDSLFASGLAYLLIITTCYNFVINVKSHFKEEKKPTDDQVMLEAAQMQDKFELLFQRFQNDHDNIAIIMKDQKRMIDDLIKIKENQKQVDEDLVELRHELKQNLADITEYRQQSSKS